MAIRKRSKKDISGETAAVSELNLDEQLYQALVDFSPFPIFLFKSDKIYYCNPAGFRLLGAKRLSEVIGKSTHDFVISEEWDILDKRQKLLSEGKSVGAQVYSFKRLDGKILIVEASTQRFKIEGEAITFSILQDITEKHNIEKALRESEEHYRGIVEDQTEFIVRWRPEGGERTFINESYARFLGTTPDKLIGKSFFSLLPEDELEIIKRQIQQITPENPTPTYEYPTTLIGNKKRWTQWVDRGLFDEAGNLIEIQSVGRDIHPPRR